MKIYFNSDFIITKREYEEYYLGSEYHNKIEVYFPMISYPDYTYIYPVFNVKRPDDRKFGEFALTEYNVENDYIVWRADLPAKALEVEGALEITIIFKYSTDNKYAKVSTGKVLLNVKEAVIGEENDVIYVGSGDNLQGEIDAIRNEFGVRFNNVETHFISDLAELEKRVSRIDGVNDIKLEIGKINISGSGWTYSNGSSRVRTPEGYSIHLKVGDRVGFTDYSDARFFTGYRKADGTYGAINWSTSDLVVDVEGDYVFALSNIIEKTLSSVNDLSDLFFVIKADNELYNIKYDITKNPIFHSDKDKFIAHRGGTEAPENTIPAFELSAKKGIWGIETDIYPTKDGEFVCCHSDSIDSTTNGTGKITNLTLAQIKSYNIDSGNNISNYPNLKIPTLEEYLQVCKTYGCVAVIEWKFSDTTGTYTKKIIDTLVKYGMEDRTIFIAYISSAKAIRKYNLSIPVGVLMYNASDNYEEKISSLIGIPNMLADLEVCSQLTDDIIDLCHKNNMPVVIWTINNIDTAKLYFSKGVDAITSDSLYSLNPVKYVKNEASDTEKDVEINKNSFQFRASDTSDSGIGSSNIYMSPSTLYIGWYSNNGGSISISNSGNDNLALSGSKDTLIQGQSFNELYRKVQNIYGLYIDFNIDDAISYYKLVPSGVATYATINKVGGMSYKSNNLFNGVYEFGSLNTSTGAFESNDFGCCSDYIKVDSNTTYSYRDKRNVSANFETIFYVVEYDANKGFIQHELKQLPVTNGIYFVSFTTQATTKYIRFMAIANYKTEYMPTEATLVKGTYTVSTLNYIEYFNGIRHSKVTDVLLNDEVVIPLNDFQQMEGYGLGINENCYNYIDFDRNVFVKKVGSYTFTGSERMGQTTSSSGLYRYWCSNLEKLIVKPSSNAEVGNILMAELDILTANQIGADNEGIAVNVNGTLIIFKKDIQTLDAMKSYLKGKTLYYELETPTETTISEIDTIIEVEEGDVITFENEYQNAVPSEIEYQVKAGN